MANAITTVVTTIEKTGVMCFLPIVAKREPDVPGTHTIHLRSSVDTISITHEAHNRKGFAKGAITALEWLVAQNDGYYKVQEMFK